MKNRIDQLFTTKKENILNLYFTAGYPYLQDTINIIKTLDSSGADMIEIGIPYSDPLADGPTIQASGTQALKNGMSLKLLFEQLKDIRKETQIPLLLMGYLNQLMQFGIDEFISHCKAVEIDGLILPDLPIDIYESEFKEKFEKAELHVVFLITPQTSEARIRKIDKLSRGFIYMVSNASITGAKRDISTAQIEYFERIQQMNLNNPRLIGFGISNKKTFDTACQYAQGAIIGSAFIKALTNGESGLEETIRDFISSIRTGVKLDAN